MAGKKGAMTDAEMAAYMNELAGGNNISTRMPGKGPQTDRDAQFPCASCPSPSRCMAAGTCMKKAIYR